MDLEDSQVSKNVISVKLNNESYSVRKNDPSFYYLNTTTQTSTKNVILALRNVMRLVTLRSKDRDIALLRRCP